MLQKTVENMKDRYNREEGSHMKKEDIKQDYALPDPTISLSKMHEFGVEKRDWVLTDFRKKTEEMFHNINGLKPAEIEEIIKLHVQEKIDEYAIDATITDVVISGSRCRGMEHEDSDLDVVVELSTNEKEDHLFNIFNEDGFCIGLSKDIKVDINPITARKSCKNPRHEGDRMEENKNGRRKECKHSSNG